MKSLFNSIRGTVAIVFTLLAAMTSALSQFKGVDGLWNDIPERGITRVGQRDVVPTEYRTLSLDMNALTTRLNQAPIEGSVAVKSSPLVLSIPIPD